MSCSSREAFSWGQSQEECCRVIHDINKLFEEPPRIKTFDDEIAALVSGEKAFSAMGFPRPSFGGDEPPDEDYLKLLDIALNAGLLVVHCQRRRPLPKGFPADIDLFILRPDQVWRIPAYLALWEAANHASWWSDGQEILESTLLGYDRAMTAAWIAHVHRRQVKWGRATIYFLMTQSQVESLADYGMLCFPRELGAFKITAFEVRSGKLPRTDAAEVAPGLVIARAAFSHSFRRDLFKEPDESDDDIVCRTLTEQNIRELNSALESKIQIWSSDGWI